MFCVEVKRIVERYLPLVKIYNIDSATLVVLRWITKKSSWERNAWRKIRVSQNLTKLRRGWPQKLRDGLGEKRGELWLWRGEELNTGREIRRRVSFWFGVNLNSVNLLQKSKGWDLVLVCCWNCFVCQNSKSSFGSGNDSRSWINNLSSWKRVWKKSRLDRESNLDHCDDQTQRSIH